MKFLWFIILSAIVLSSCEIGGESREAVCRHKAVMGALVYSEQYPVRIAWGPNDIGSYHAQAQAYIDGEWYFLHVIPMQIIIVTDEKDDWFTVEKTYDLESYLNQFWLERGLGTKELKG